VGPAHHAGDACLLPVRDFFKTQQGEEIAVAPFVALCALDEVAL
jgi:hypothetical protein